MKKSISIFSGNTCIFIDRTFQFICLKKELPQMHRCALTMATNQFLHYEFNICASVATHVATIMTGGCYRISIFTEKSMRAAISNFLRQFGLLYVSDRIRFIILYLKRFRKIVSFRKKYPGIEVPPAYLVYESFDLNYETYYSASKESAAWLLDHFRNYKELRNVNILDWGCGPARIVRHLPGLLDKSCAVYGTDYNPKSIQWNRDHIPGVNFNLNQSSPPLPYVDNSFDIIYGISIFTHLPESLHYKWFDELIRISKNGGIIFLTLHGRAFKSKLTAPEQEKFDHGQLLIKGNTRIGHRTFAAFHPPSFVNQWFGKHELLLHEEGGVINSKPQQDIWIIRVNK
jgi:SAM-dependent methyltransferase